MATTDEQPDRNHDTVALVKTLKDAFLKNQHLHLVDRSYIEILIGRIRSSKFDKKRWEEKFPDHEGFDKAFMLRVMAYTDDPENVEDLTDSLLKQKHQKATKTYLTPVFSALQRLSEPMRLRDILGRILKYPDEETMRADRLFYIYMKDLLGPGVSYTIEDAHEQVQAIRLSHFETDDEKEMIRFARKYKTFDEAHAYLQSLMKERCAEEAPRTRDSRKPLVAPKPRQSPETPDRSKHSKSRDRPDRDDDDRD